MKLRDRPTNSRIPRQIVGESVHRTGNVTALGVAENVRERPNEIALVWPDLPKIVVELGWELNSEFGQITGDNMNKQLADAKRYGLCVFGPQSEFRKRLPIG